jgi:predicted dehydrogenase
VSAYGITKRQGEQLVRESGIPHAILRPGLVFGPGEQGLFWRMRQSVRKLPVLPPLGGGKAAVQPIHVDDVCKAILRCLSFAPDENAELNLGEPNAMSLRDFLQAIARAERGKAKPQLSIPLGPVKAVVSIGESLHLSLPISSDNLRGMQVVQTMDTAPSLQRLGMQLRPFEEAMRASVAPPPTVTPSRGPVKLLLVGAGKIGIVHALNARQRSEETLAGVVDQSPKAYRLYESMGYRAPFFTRLEQAISAVQPDGAILATPASTHLSLARWCLERKLPVLIEKPLAIRAEDVAEFRKLAAEFPALACHAGYMAAQFPQLERAKQIVQSGVLGNVKSFRASALQSHIMASAPVRWEMVSVKSGGGAMINFGSHVLSMLFRLFGMPQESEAASWPIHSTEVEDAVALRLVYRGFSGEMLTSWSAPGYSRPENRIEIECQQAMVVIDNFGTSVRMNGRTEQFWSQRDFELGYNAAPDYTGAGFSQEHANFVRAIRGENAAPSFSEPVGLDEACHLEEWIFGMYSICGLALPADDKLQRILTTPELLRKARELRELGTAK